MTTYYQELTPQDKALYLSMATMGGIDKAVVNKDQYIYMLKHKDTDAVKIGISISPYDRARHIAGFRVLWAFKTFDARGIEILLKALLHTWGKTNCEHMRKSSTEIFTLNEAERTMTLIMAKYIEAKMLANAPLGATTTGDYELHGAIGVHDLDDSPFGDAIKKRAAVVFKETRMIE